MMIDHNKEAAVSFLKLAASGKAHDAYSEFIGAQFRHHNPYFEGSAQALITAMDENALENPSKRIEVRHVIAEGDLVVVHFYVQHKPGDLGAAVVHIFRFENGRIVELWDVGQQVPEESPNQYGMF